MNNPSARYFLSHNTSFPVKTKTKKRPVPRPPLPEPPKEDIKKEDSIGDISSIGYLIERALGLWEYASTPAFYASEPETLAPKPPQKVKTRVSIETMTIHGVPRGYRSEDESYKRQCELTTDIFKPLPFTRKGSPKRKKIMRQPKPLPMQPKMPPGIPLFHKALRKLPSNIFDSD